MDLVVRAVVRKKEENIMDNYKHWDFFAWWRTQWGFFYQKDVEKIKIRASMYNKFSYSEKIQERLKIL